MQKQPLIIERTYNAAADKVWSAITDASKMRQWYFDLEEFKPEVGFTFEFSAECDGLSYLHTCEVTEVVEGKKIVYSWKYRDYPGMSYVMWELFPEGEKTRLVLTHTGLETFPKHKDFTTESFTGGWNYFLGDALKKYLEE
ncbi:MAG: SRPBCC domain-containing protein [Flavobacterium psychrophilum]|nr:MAG: SRPBCC domain-containing protein [Flavobacterium psychrophilum]